MKLKTKAKVIIAVIIMALPIWIHTIKTFPSRFSTAALIGFMVQEFLLAMLILWPFAVIYKKIRKDKKKRMDKYTAETISILEESQKDTFPYWTEVAGRKFKVLKGVFSPRYFNDTDIFARHLKVEPGQKILEIGPGTGAISISKALEGAIVTAVDINPKAVKNTKLNAKIHGIQDRVKVFEGDLFKLLPLNSKFDTIFWNTPFAFVPENANLSDLEKSVCDPGYKSTKKFILECPKYLKPGGKIVIGFSSTLGRLDLVEKFTKKAGLLIELIHEEESTEVIPVKFELFELKLRS